MYLQCYSAVKHGIFKEIKSFSTYGMMCGHRSRLMFGVDEKSRVTNSVDTLRFGVELRRIAGFPQLFIVRLGLMPHPVYLTRARPQLSAL